MFTLPRTVITAEVFLTCVIGSMRVISAEQLAMNNVGDLVGTVPQRFVSVSSQSSSSHGVQGVVRDETAKEAQQVFQEGGKFYIYREDNEMLRGQGSVSGMVRYLKGPGVSPEAVKIYSYIVTRGLYGERRRFGVATEASACTDAGGELRVSFNGTFRSSISHTTTKVSGKTMLHVVVLPADTDTRKLGFGCTIPAISNELLIPVSF